MMVCLITNMEILIALIEHLHVEWSIFPSSHCWIYHSGTPTHCQASETYLKIGHLFMKCTVINLQKELISPISNSLYDPKGSAGSFGNIDVHAESIWCPQVSKSKSLLKTLLFGRQSRHKATFLGTVAVFRNWRGWIWCTSIFQEKRQKIIKLHLALQKHS